MNLFVETDQLGKLEIIEVYLYYDRPLLFTCMNELGQHYLSMLFDDDDSEEVWLLAPMSPGRYRQVRSGGVDLRDAYATAEGGWLARLVLDCASGDVLQVRRILISDVDASILPAAGERLALDTPTLAARDPMHLSKMAREVRRVAIDLALDVASRRRSEVPARTLGRVLTAFQDTLDAIGQVVSSLATSRGRIASAITASTQLEVVGVHSSLFTVEMVSSQTPDLFWTSGAADALEELANVMNTADEASALTPVLSELGPRAVSKYRDFLSTLISDDAAVTLDWRFPEESRGGHAHMAPQRAVTVVAVIDMADIQSEQELTVYGQLVGANIRVRSFEIYVSHEKKTYEGKVAEEALEQVDGARIGRSYWAMLSATTAFRAVRQEATTNYVLKALSSA